MAENGQSQTRETILKISEDLEDQVRSMINPELPEGKDFQENTNTSNED